MSNKVAITISPRGQLTIPLPLRKQLGLPEGGTVVAEIQDGALRIQPAALVGIRLYTDAEAKQYVDDAAIDPAEFQRISEKIKSMGPKKK